MLDFKRNVSSSSGIANDDSKLSVGSGRRRSQVVWQSQGYISHGASRVSSTCRELQLWLVNGHVIRVRLEKRQFTHRTSTTTLSSMVAFFLRTAFTLCHSLLAGFRSAGQPTHFLPVRQSSRQDIVI
jgi:hypothetical protein